MLVLSTEFYIRLGTWDPASGMPKDQLRLQNWTQHAKLWQGGSRVVVLPLVWRSHFYGLVATLEEETCYVLESLGASFGKPPPHSWKFCRFLELLREEAGTVGPDFQVKVVQVPRQGTRSNNCGLFLLKFVDKILEETRDFLVRAREDALADWFPASEVDGKREEVAGHIRQLATDQRMPGGSWRERCWTCSCRCLLWRRSRLRYWFT